MTSYHPYLGSSDQHQSFHQFADINGLSYTSPVFIPNDARVGSPPMYQTLGAPYFMSPQLPATPHPTPKMAQMTPIDGRRRTGVCKFFNASKGFGFIEDDVAHELPITASDPGSDSTLLFAFPLAASVPDLLPIMTAVFVHFTCIVTCDSPFKSLLDGELVEYCLGRSTKGLAAIDVTGPGGIAVKGNPMARSIHGSLLNGGMPLAFNPMSLPLPLSPEANFAPRPSPSFADPYTLHKPTSWNLPSFVPPSASSVDGARNSPASTTVSGCPSPGFTSPTFALAVGMPAYSAPGSQGIGGFHQHQSGYQQIQYQQPAAPVNRWAGPDPYQPAWQRLSNPVPAPQWSPPGGRRESLAEEEAEPAISQVLGYGEEVLVSGQEEGEIIDSGSGSDSLGTGSGSGAGSGGGESDEDKGEAIKAGKEKGRDRRLKSGPVKVLYESPRMDDGFHAHNSGWA